MGSVGTGGEKHRIPQAARPHLAINASALSTLGGGMASEAVGKDTGVALLKDHERGKFIPLSHRLGVLIDDLGHDLGARLNAHVDADLIEGLFRRPFMAADLKGFDAVEDRDLSPKDRPMATLI